MPGVYAGVDVNRACTCVCVCISYVCKFSTMSLIAFIFPCFTYSFFWVFFIHMCFVIGDVDVAHTLKCASISTQTSIISS